jgi:DNA-binding Xre family transcriptional regulator
MVDVYEEALKKLRADRRSFNELEEVIGIPAETIRDIKRRIVKNPRLDTLRKIVAVYQREAA